MKVNSPFKWWRLELYSRLCCWLRSAGKWCVCVTRHRRSWRRWPVHHSWEYHCTRCDRRWMIYD